MLRLKGTSKLWRLQWLSLERKADSDLEGNASEPLDTAITLFLDLDGGDTTNSHVCLVENCMFCTHPTSVLPFFSNLS